MSKASPGSDSQIDLIFQQHFASVGKGVRPTQRQVIRSVLQGNNTLGLMPTGSGKSLCYWIAGKALGGTTLVISPLTALIDEQADKLRGHGCKVLVLHSGIDARTQSRGLLELYNGREVPEFIFLSPERAATDGFLEFVLQSAREKIRLVVVDEAHCISQWGLDFRPFYRDIPVFLQNIFGESSLPTVLCLTATLNPKDREQICQDFSITESHVIRHDVLLRREIDVRVVEVPDEDTKDDRFWALLEEHRQEKILVYVDRVHGKRSTEELCQEAVRRGFSADYFHSERSSDEKADIISRFRAGGLRLIFATSAFGMGIDIPDIRGVVHYLLTESVEQYYQQIGRVGRDGNPSWAVLLYSDKNIDVRKSYFIEKSFPTEKDISAAFLALTDEKLGRRTVNYFGEGDSARSAYHYLLRSGVISTVCKGITSLGVLEPAKGASLPEFARYRQATRTGLLIRTAQKTGESEVTILRDIYRWLAEGKLTAERALGKCLVIDSASVALPDELLVAIMSDVAEKKGYRMRLFDEFVALLREYTNTFDFHQRVGEYLGIDKFSRERKHKTLSGDLVRSKSEVIIANILYQSGIPFKYEAVIFGADGTPRSPDFTIEWGGRAYYWEHLGMLDDENYARDWEQKKAWYERNYPGQLITTRETSTLSQEARQIIVSRFGVEPVEASGR